jgi:hypothetical protein
MSRVPVPRCWRLRRLPRPDDYTSRRLAIGAPVRAFSSSALGYRLGLASRRHTDGKGPPKPQVQAGLLVQYAKPTEPQVGPRPGRRLFPSEQDTKNRTIPRARLASASEGTNAR